MFKTRKNLYRSSVKIYSKDTKKIKPESYSPNKKVALDKKTSMMLPSLSKNASIKMIHSPNLPKLDNSNSPYKLRNKRSVVISSLSPMKKSSVINSNYSTEQFKDFNATSSNLSNNLKIKLSPIKSNANYLKESVNKEEKNPFSITLHNAAGKTKEMKDKVRITHQQPWYLNIEFKGK